MIEPAMFREFETYCFIHSFFLDLCVVISQCL